MSFIAVVVTSALVYLALYSIPDSVWRLGLIRLFIRSVLYVALWAGKLVVPIMRWVATVLLALGRRFKQELDSIEKDRKVESDSRG